MAADALAQLEELFKAGFIPEEEYSRRKGALPDPEKEHALKVFQYFDTDKDNAISSKEFQNLVYELGEIMTNDQVQAILKIVDTNGNGIIEFNEFYSWWVSPNHKADTASSERMNILKAKLTSKSYMRNVRGVANKLRGSRAAHKLQERAKGRPHETPLSDDDHLTVSFEVELGNFGNVLSGISVRHRRDPAGAAALRTLVGQEEGIAIASLAFLCKSDANLAHLHAASKYLTIILRGIIEDEKIPVQVFKFHTSEENGENFLRATAALPLEFSMMGTGLFGTIGLRDFCVDLLYGGASSKVTFRVSVSRGAIALIDELEVLRERELKKFATFLLNNFCGAELKFHFSSVAEALQHPYVAELARRQQIFEQFLASGKKLAHDDPGVREGAHVELVDNVLALLGSRAEKLGDILQFFQASWFATKCARDNLKELTILTVVVGDEIFEVKFNFPNFFEIFPSEEKARNMGLFDQGQLPRKYVVSDEQGANLPERLQWSGHEHVLERKRNFFDWVSDFWCDECDAFGSGWCYTCQECMVAYHPEHVKEL